MVIMFNFFEISELIKNCIEKVKLVVELCNEGIVISVFDGIVCIFGLVDVMQGEMIELLNNIFVLVLNLECDLVGVVVLGGYEYLCEGDVVKIIGCILEVLVGLELLGCVVNVFGELIDGKGLIVVQVIVLVECVVLGVIWCKLVDQLVQIGYKFVDLMILIGCGQCELVIGDCQIGKIVLVIDVVINQKDIGIKCVYVVIGQKVLIVVNIVCKLEENGVLVYIVVVVVIVFELVVMQYISVYLGCIMGEYFMDCGEDVLIVYDDLFKQVVVYCQILLLLKCLLGCEVYLGDVFYLYFCLFECVVCVFEEYVEKFINGVVKGKIGLLIVLLIIEIQVGDVLVFVLINVILIIDGQIFLEIDLFNFGICLVVNVGILVLCVGGVVQIKIIKKLFGGICILLVQYCEFVVFVQFVLDLDEVICKQLECGQCVIELMKQKQYVLMLIVNQVLLIYVVNEGYFDDVLVNKLLVFEEGLYVYFVNIQGELVGKVNVIGGWDNDIEVVFKKGIVEFKIIGSW